MSAVPATTDRKPTRLEAFRSELLSEDRKTDLYRSLPPHVRPERFERNLVNALMAQPKLLEVDPRRVFREVAKIAALGLVLDPQLGECYLIADGKGEVQARIGYRGLIKLARQSGDIETVYSHDICENDTVRVALGTEKKLEHEPDFLSDRGKQRAFYAVFKTADGEPDFEVMTITEIEAIRDRSDAWKAFKRGAIKSTPWATDFGEMAKKTVLRRLLKRAPMSPELAEVLAEEDRYDMREARDITPRPATVTDRLTALPREDAPTQGFSPEHIERETAEVEAPAEQAEVIEGRLVDEDGALVDDGEPLSEAYVAGRDARKRGQSSKAVPGTLSEQDRIDWIAGWTEADAEMRNGKGA